MASLFCAVAARFYQAGLCFGLFVHNRFTLANVDDRKFLIYYNFCKRIYAKTSRLPSKLGSNKLAGKGWWFSSDATGEYGEIKMREKSSRIVISLLLAIVHACVCFRGGEKTQCDIMFFIRIKCIFNFST